MSNLEAPLMLNNIHRFWSSTYSQVDNVLFREGLHYSSETIPNHILHVLQQHDCIVKKVQVLNWPSCSPKLKPIDNVWHFMNT